MQMFKMTPHSILTDGVKAFYSTVEGETLTIDNNCSLTEWKDNENMVSTSVISAIAIKFCF